MRVLRGVGYVVFFLLCLVLGLYFTFPWNAAKDWAFSRLTDSAWSGSRGEGKAAGGATAARGLGLTLTAREIEPSLLTGVIARDLRIEVAGHEAPLEFERVDARAHLFKLLLGRLGVTAKAPIAKGQVVATIVRDEDGFDVASELTDVELALIPLLAEASGLPLSGQVSTTLEAHWSLVDAKKSEGELKIKAKDLEIIKAGKVGSIPVPPLVVGSGELFIPIEKGRARLSEQRINGESAEIVLDGEIVLNKDNIMNSVSALMVSVKPSEAFLKKEPLLAALLNNIKHAQSPDGFYSFSMTGPLRSPRFVPRRKT